jgi:hypothetical protein
VRLGQRFTLPHRESDLYSYVLTITGSSHRSTVGRVRLSDAELQRYASEFWQLQSTDPKNAMFPEWLHRRLTRPVAPITRAGQPHSQSYVVCLDCGKQFEYDLKEMRIGKAIDHSHNAGVVPPNLPKPRADRRKYVALAAVPVAAVLAAMVKTKNLGPRGARVRGTSRLMVRLLLLKGTPESKKSNL